MKKGKIFAIALKAVALAMGIAVVVLSVLDKIEMKSASSMLGIGLACLAITQFFRREERVMNEGFITPDGHTGFLAKKLFDEMGKIQWGAIAYIEKNGGGPQNNHTHCDNHIFIVVDGEVRVVMGDKETIVEKNQAVFVNGMIPHSIWNNSDRIAVVIKISTERDDGEM